MQTKKDKPYGWEVVAEFYDGWCYIPGSDENEKKTFAYRNCSQTAAIRRVRYKRHCRGIVEVIPLTEEQFIRAYGLGRMQEAHGNNTGRIERGAAVPDLDGR